MSWPKGVPRKKKVEEKPVEVQKIEDVTSDTPITIVDPPKTKETVRRYSTEEDRKGPHHPLCLICDHREDMHHDWKYFTRVERVRDLSNGRWMDREVEDKEPTFNRARPCQHACPCTDYK